MTAPRTFPLFPAFASLTGLLFCLWVMFTGGKALCLTDGCMIFQDFRLADVSLWQTGTVLFAVLLALSVLHLERAGLLLAGAAVAADVLLLGVMLFTAPCVNCLIVGGLIALTFFAFLRRTERGRPSRSPLLMIWALFFLFDTGSVLRDSASPWSPLPAEGPASVHIYFSPSCRACQTLLEQAERVPDARWIPVAEDSRDIWLIHAMEKALNSGLPLREAVAEAQRKVPGLADIDDAPGYRSGLLRPDMLRLQFRLWKNQAHVLAAGSDRLPFVEFRGLPAFLRSPETPTRDDEGPTGLPGDLGAPAPPAIPGLDDFGVAGFCGGDSEKKSCEDTDSTPIPDSTGTLIDISGMTR